MPALRDDNVLQYSKTYVSSPADGICCQASPALTSDSAPERLNFTFALLYYGLVMLLWFFLKCNTCVCNKIISFYGSIVNCGKGREGFVGGEVLMVPDLLTAQSYMTAHGVNSLSPDANAAAADYLPGFGGVQKAEWSASTMVTTSGGAML
jgi:hypothetical protein